MPGVADIRFVDKVARNAFFDFEQAVILDSWIERGREKQRWISEES